MPPERALAAFRQPFIGRQNDGEIGRCPARIPDSTSDTRLRMARLDVSNAVDLLIRAAAPGRAPELRHEWGDQINRVHLTDDPGFDIGAWFGLIQVTESALRQVWLLGFASWRAIQAYSGVIWLLQQTNRPFNRDEIAVSHGQAASASRNANSRADENEISTGKRPRERQIAARKEATPRLLGT
jgi:hypothetical protein